MLSHHDQIDIPRCLPTSQDTPPRTVAATCCPSRCSITGFHGTSEKPMQGRMSSSITNHRAHATITLSAISNVAVYSGLHHE